MSHSTPYKTPQSWGEPYGEHKQYLEFSEDQYRELKKCADENNVLFSASGWDYRAVDFLVDLGAPFLKVASVDAGNLQFIEYLAQKNVPLVISSGILLESHQLFCFFFRRVNSWISSTLFQCEYVNIEIDKLLSLQLLKNSQHKPVINSPTESKGWISQKRVIDVIWDFLAIRLSFRF